MKDWPKRLKPKEWQQNRRLLDWNKKNKSARHKRKPNSLLSRN